LHSLDDVEDDALNWLNCSNLWNTENKNEAYLVDISIARVAQPDVVLSWHWAV